MYFRMLFIPEFSTSLLKSSESHDLSEILLIYRFGEETLFIISADNVFAVCNVCGSCELFLMNRKLKSVFL